MGNCLAKSGAGSQAEVLTWDGQVQDPKPWDLGQAVRFEDLDHLRKEFWDTRVEGRAEMWAALKVAAEADSKQLRTQIIEAAGIKPALKRKTLELVYDELGAIYEVPVYCLTPPQSLDGENPYAELKDVRFHLQNFYEEQRPKFQGQRV